MLLDLKKYNEEDRIVHLLRDVQANDDHASAVYNSLQLASEDDRAIIQRYVENSHGPTHLKFRVQLEEVYSIRCPRDRQFLEEKGNRRLVFHGTTKPNVYKILRDGFRWKVSKEEGNFGQGIYFSDCVTKAANYTVNDPRKFAGGGDIGLVDPPIGESHYLFLAEVALGISLTYNTLPAFPFDFLRGRESIRAIGKYTYRTKDWTREYFPGLNFDALVPQGPLQRRNECDLNYDEFIIYKSIQARHRYLLKIKFLPRLDDPPEDALELALHH